jgi:hypothetical protein
MVGLTDSLLVDVVVRAAEKEKKKKIGEVY